MTRFILLFTFFIATLALSAQSVGIGAQFGDPTGLSLRFNRVGNLNYDVLAAWDFDDYFFVNVHGLWEHSLANEPRMNYFYGPGAFIGVRERGRWRDNAGAFGISGTVGLNIYIKKLEIFAQITPRLAIIERTDGNIGGGVGVRFYVK